MAENKKSFILYVDLIHTVKHLTDEQAGKLFKHILSYCNDENPASDDVITNLAFEPVKQALKRDLKKYENYIEKQKANGKKGGRPKEINYLKSYTGKIVPPKGDYHFVYIIEDVVKDEVKIGETSNLIQRRYDIKRPTNNLEIVDFHLLDAYNCQRIEKEILKEYKECSIGGDWFKVDKITLNNLKNKLCQKTQAFSKIPKKADSVSVSVSDNVNVINNNIDAWIKDISNSPSYLEGIYMKLKLRKGTISSLLKDFKAHLKMYETDSTNVSEFKRHFSNWLNNENAKGRLAQYQKETKGQL